MDSNTKTRPTHFPYSGGTSCVQVEPIDGGVRVTSTIDGNDGVVEFTTLEWDTFINTVHAGGWDWTRVNDDQPAAMPPVPAV